MEKLSFPTAAIMAVALLVITLGWGRYMQKAPLAPEAGAILMIELARVSQDIKDALKLDKGEGEIMIDKVRENTRMDGVFIFLYWLTFLALAAILAISPTPWIRAVAVAIVLTITGAAVCDYLENWHIFRALAAAHANTLNDAMAVNIHRPSLFKWGLLGIASWLLAGAFLARGIELRPHWVQTILSWAFTVIGGWFGFYCVQLIASWFIRSRGRL